MRWSEIDDRALRRAWEDVRERERSDEEEAEGSLGFCQKHRKRFFGHDCPRCEQEIAAHEFGER